MRIAIPSQNVRSCRSVKWVKKLWGTDADPLAHKGDWEKQLAKISKQHQFQGKSK